MRQCRAYVFPPHTRSRQPAEVRTARLHVPGALATGTRIDLPAAAAAHIARVLRARSGDPLILFNGDGCEYHGKIDSVRGSRVSVTLAGQRAVDRESALRITLVQAVARGERMDFVIQKATELGVWRVVPVLSERSVVRLDAGQRMARVEHWHSVAAHACEQCGRNRLPLIDPPMDLREHLAARDHPDARFILDPEAGGTALQATLPGSVEITVGPEGGFSAGEMEAMHLAGLSSLRFGPRILRTETAALFALSWLQACFGDMSPVMRR